MSQTDIDAFLNEARGKEAQALGPAILRLNSFSMPDMLAALNSLSPQDQAKFRQAALDGIPAPGCGSSSTLSEAKRVYIKRIQFAFEVVTSKKIPNDIPGDIYETGQFKDACFFLKISPTKNVWITIIGAICEDARLRKKGEEGGLMSKPTVMGGDATYGQAGWDIGIKYGTAAFASLPNLVSSKCKGFLLNRVGINAHGEAGEVAVNGVNEKMQAFDPILKKDNVATFDAVFSFFDKIMIDGGTLLFLSCLAGNGPAGTELLLKLSGKLPSRKIVGFSKVGFTSVEKQRRGGDQCTEPGVRDTPYPIDPTPDIARFGDGQNNKTEYDKYFKDGKWDDLNILPWQSETSQHAKVALNGQIIRGTNL